jgi:hypothetical protein
MLQLQLRFALRRGLVAVPKEAYHRTLSRHLSFRFPSNDSNSAKSDSGVAARAFFSVTDPTFSPSCRRHCYRYGRYLRLHADEVHTDPYSERTERLAHMFLQTGRCIYVCLYLYDPVRQSNSPNSQSTNSPIPGPLPQEARLGSQQQAAISVLKRKKSGRLAESYRTVAGATRQQRTRSRDSRQAVTTTIAMAVSCPTPAGVDAMVSE